MATEGDVRRIALSLPETSEGTWYGTPGYKVRGKGFLRFRTETDDGRLVCFVAGLGEKEALLTSHPEIYSTTDHYADHPIVLIDLDRIGVDELRELIAESWRQKAPRRLVADHEPRDANRRS